MWVKYIKAVEFLIQNLTESKDLVSKYTAVITGDVHPAEGKRLYGQHILKMEEDSKDPGKISKIFTSQCETSSHLRPATFSFPALEHYYKSVRGKKKN